MYARSYLHFAQLARCARTSANRLSIPLKNAADVAIAVVVVIRESFCLPHISGAAYESFGCAMKRLIAMDGPTNGGRRTDGRMRATNIITL